MLLEASPQLNSLPQLWLQHLLDHMQRPGQSRDDIVRRSAGLPAAFVALFTAEPTGHPKALLYTGRSLHNSRVEAVDMVRVEAVDMVGHCIQLQLLPMTCKRHKLVHLLTKFWDPGL